VHKRYSSASRKNGASIDLQLQFSSTTAKLILDFIRKHDIEIPLVAGPDRANGGRLRLRFSRARYFLMSVIQAEQSRIEEGQIARI
jgi:hypothetical protein